MTGGVSTLFQRSWKSSYLTWLFALGYLAWVGSGAWLGFERYKDPSSTTAIKQTLALGPQESLTASGVILRSELINHVTDPFFIGEVRLDHQVHAERPRMIELLMRFRNVEEGGHLAIVDDEGKELFRISPLIHEMTTLHMRLPEGTGRLWMRMSSSQARLSFLKTSVLDAKEGEVAFYFEQESNHFKLADGNVIVMGTGWSPSVLHFKFEGDPAMPMTEVGFIGILVAVPGEYEVTLSIARLTDLYQMPRFVLNGTVIHPEVDTSDYVNLIKFRTPINPLVVLRIELPGQLTSPFQRDASFFSPRPDARPMSYWLWPKRTKVRKLK